MEEKSNYNIHIRILWMLLGILLIGICVASLRLSGFGVDPFTCMNLGISGWNGMQFGTWQFLMNIALLIVVFFTVRHCIGLGTIINSIGVGYIADFLCWLVTYPMNITITWPLRILFLFLGLLFAPLGCSFYMEANLGIAPYDSVAFIITKATKEKISFRVARVSSDIVCVLIGVRFCLPFHGKMSTILGLGTIINAFCNGPLIQFFRTVFSRKFSNAIVN